MRSQISHINLHCIDIAFYEKKTNFEQRLECVAFFQIADDTLCH